MAREGYGRLLAILASRTRDLAAAEDALAEALASALSQWPRTGVPANPEGWLVAVARRRQADAWRRAGTRAAARDHLGMIAEERAEEGEAMHLPDRRLALMLACTAPGIDPAARTPLMLQVVLGLTAAEIAGAYLVSPAAMGQRLARAKARLREAGLPFEVPEGEDLARRIPEVLDAVYAAYALGWDATPGPGTDRTPGALAAEAVWLGRVALTVLPGDPEAQGMVALMLFAEARRPARRSLGGAYIPLDEQDTALWDRGMLGEAEVLLGAASRSGATGRFQIEAAIQSAHVVRRLYGLDTWPDILALYDVLLALHPGPVVALNRAVALARVAGPDAALAELAPLGEDRRMAGYQPYWATRAQLLAEAGSPEEAAEAFRIAAGLAADPAVRAWLMDRASSLRSSAPNQG